MSQFTNLFFKRRGNMQKEPIINAPGIPPLASVQEILALHYPEAQKSTLKSVREAKSRELPLGKQTPESQSTSEELWKLRLQHLSREDFANVVLPSSRAAYWLGFKNGYYDKDSQRRHRSREITSVPLKGRPLESYEKGLKEGAEFWDCMFVGT